MPVDEKGLDPVVRKLEGVCASHDGHTLLYRHAAARLKVLWDVVESGEAQDPVSFVSDLRSTVQRVLQALKVRQFPLRWVADSQRAVVDAHETHERIDALYEALGISENEQMAAWRVALRHDRLEHERSFEERLELSTDAMLFSDARRQMELRPDAPKMERWDALVTLRNQLKAWSMNGLGDDQVTISTKPKVSRELSDLMRKTADRVFRYSEERNEEMDPWYIPERDILLERGRGSTPTEESAFWILYKGSWLNAWEQTKIPVAVRVLSYNAVNGSDRFSKELAVWLKHPHENVLEKFGANHLSKPPFIISEYATEGSFWNFFGRDNENKKLLWDLFKQAATGLEFLHDNHVEHGGLTPDNLLVTRAGSGQHGKLVAKVNDFGNVAMDVEIDSAGIAPTSQFVNWMVPERLFKSTDTIDFRLSDTYSLGLCIWAAATRELPYGFEDEETIIEKKLELVPPDRPDGAFTDAEWQLVSSMIDSKPENRPTLEDAIKRMGELDEIRQRA